MLILKQTHEQWSLRLQWLLYEYDADFYEIEYTSLDPLDKHYFNYSLLVICLWNLYYVITILHSFVNYTINDYYINYLGLGK